MIGIQKYKAHPWHGVSPGDQAPEVVTAFIEIVPGDTVKYEIDKSSGYLKIDRPQLYSNAVPALYGFIPQTYCGAGIAALAAEKSTMVVEKGDGDPLDICVLCERPVSHGDILLRARSIGGLRMIDKGEADDKIIAVLMDDAAYGNIMDIAHLPVQLLDRIRHYFLTYKLKPGELQSGVQLAAVYSKEEAFQVIRESLKDYQELLEKSYHN
ncbi:MAG: inorganic pyrophosphatase [Bacteroidia bacterium]